MIFVIAGCRPAGPSVTETTKEPIPCDLLSGVPADTDIECGRIVVPEDHDDPEGKQIQITFIVIKAENRNTQTFPVMYFTGGPGATALTYGTIWRWINNPIRENRDIILLDQRGTGNSSPLPNMEEALFEIMSQNASEAREMELMEDLIARYRKIITDQGIGLENYNSFQNARDVGILMEVLEYGKYNLYGGSYGTRLARVVQDLFPDRINSVILNSPSPLGLDFLVDRMEAYSLALERIFDNCDQDRECLLQFPNLRQSYFEAIEQLKENPVEVEMGSGTFFVNAQDGIYLLRRRLYSNDARNNIPRLIMAFRNRDGQAFKDVIETELLFSQNYNSSMFLAVERYEMFLPQYNSDVIDSLYRTIPLFPAKLGLFTSLYLAGKDWHGAELSEKDRRYGRSSIPTLITVNYYDPVTPPRNGEIIMRDLEKGTLFVLNEGGHGGGNRECRNRVIIDFMDDPEGDLNASCLNIHPEFNPDLN